MHQSTKVVVMAQRHVVAEVAVMRGIAYESSQLLRRRDGGIVVRSCFLASTVKREGVGDKYYEVALKYRNLRLQCK